ncbi:urea active transporter [Orobanche hederae]
MVSSSPPTCSPFGFSAKYCHLDGVSCVKQSSFFEGKSVLNQGVGYSVIPFFAVFTSFLRYVGSKHTSKWFNTVGRNVKTGIIASVIVSQSSLLWTWAATILQSSNVVWEYGISGPFWQSRSNEKLLMLIPFVRLWGTAAHVVFLIFCFITNIIVTAMLLLGGSAVVNALTGVNNYAVSFLISLGVIVYTLAGGLKSTFVDAVHVVLVIFVYLVYVSSSELGSPDVVYRCLVEVTKATY